MIPSRDVEPVIQALEEALALELARRDIDRVWALEDVVGLLEDREAGQD